MSKKYPKKLFVQVQGEVNDSYYQAETGPDKLDDGKIAVYELKEMKDKRTEIHLD